MKILFIHQNFPGQFLHLAAHLGRDPGHQVWALTMQQHPAPPGVHLRRYSLLRPAAPETHPLLRDAEAKILRAEACAAAAMQLKREGMVPDVILAHPGWGEALFMKDVFPQAKLVLYCEYYYALEGQDVGFDPEVAALSFEQRCHLRLKNSVNLLSLEVADAAIAPTHWQKNTFPAWARPAITVIHDGIDLQRLQPNPRAGITLAGRAGGAPLQFAPGAEVLSYVARNLEPVRGFQVWMRTLPEILRRRPKAHAIVVGGDAVSYGAPAPDGKSWKAHLLDQVGADLDLSRVHFLGTVPYQRYLDLLQVSRVHCYWTTPFVLSWSFLEAAASGLPVIASATPPVTEFAARLGVRTVDFFDQAGFADATVEQLGRRAAARTPRHLDELDVVQCVAAQTAWLRALMD